MLRMGAITITVQDAPLVPQGVAGNLVRDWNDPVTITYNYCAFQPLSTTEYISDREFAETHWKCVVPGFVQVASPMRVLVAGVAYEVNGDPEFWYDLWGREHHTTFLVERWAG